jgi:hypothetical protein
MSATITAVTLGQSRPPFRPGGDHAADQVWIGKLFRRGRAGRAAQGRRAWPGRCIHRDSAHFVKSTPRDFLTVIATCAPLAPNQISFGDN